VASPKHSAPRLSVGSRSLLADYRECDGPDHAVARSSWQALRERINHPDAEVREAWVRQLPEVSGPLCEDDFRFDDDSHGEFDDALAPAHRAPPLWLHHARSVAASVAIAASVLLGVRVVMVSATTLTEQARGQSQEAPYQGKADQSRGQAAPGQAVAAGEASIRKRGRSAAPKLAAPTAEPATVDVSAPPQPVPATPTIDPGQLAALSTNKARKARPASPPEAAPIDDIAVETALVKEATQAKNRGDSAKALALLEQHRQRFPAGAMAAVRQVLRAEVHCMQGQQGKARTLVERFATQHPKSALLGRMNKVCAQ